MKLLIKCLQCSGILMKCLLTSSLGNRFLELLEPSIGTNVYTLVPSQTESNGLPTLSRTSVNSIDNCKDELLFTSVNEIR